LYFTLCAPASLPPPCSGLPRRIGPDYNRFGPMKSAAVLLFPLCFAFLLNGCYLLKQGTYVVSYASRARSIEKVLAGDCLPAEVRGMLQTVQEIRRYAEEQIGLQANRNYTRYVELDRDYVVEVVTACPADSFTPHQWRFPVFGSFPYKGFYESEDAEREAGRLRDGGMDVWVRRVDGFSTLGMLSDPIYSFMTDYSPYALAELIIHEQTHATVFIRNEIQFDEEMATFVGREGALAFLRDRYGADSKAYAQALARLDDLKVYGQQMIELYNRLERLYQGETDRERIPAEKRRIVEEFNRRLRSRALELFRTDSFRSFEGIPPNNAFILSFVRYHRDLDLFYRLYEAKGRDLRATVAALKLLKQAGEPPEKRLRQLIDN
jgi:predicted aminopeptidase